MADQNQSPASQASVTLSGITFPLTLAGTPTWQAAPLLSLTVLGGSLSLATTVTPSVTVLARALGRATTVSTSAASGMFTPNEQSAAKRLGAWP